MMQQQEKKTLKNHLRYLTENVGSVPKILDFLYEDGIFTESDRERVQAEVTTEDKIRKTVNIIVYKDNRAIPCFKKALRLTEQEYIVEELEKTVPYQTSQINDDFKLFISNVLKEKFMAADRQSKVSLPEVLNELRDTARHHGRTAEFDDVDDGAIVVIVKEIFNSCIVESSSPGGKHISYASKYNKTKTNIQFAGIWYTYLQFENRDDMMGVVSCNDQVIGATGDTNVISVESNDVCTDAQPKRLHDMNLDELCKWLTDIKQRTGLEFDIEIFRKNEMDGETFSCLTIDELKDLIPPLGPRKKLVMERDKETTTKEFAESKHIDIKVVERLRRFDSEAGITDQYRGGSVVNTEQTRVKNLIDPVHKFILPKSKGEDILNCIILETVKFGAACMNDRTNGTIHFGIADSSENEGSNMGGKIVGIYVDKIQYQQRLTEGIQRFFFPEQQSKALSCIRPAQFIEVTASVLKPHVSYVIEVDVVPSYRNINGETFFLQLLDKDSCDLYRYSQDGPTLQNRKQINEYMKECHTLSENRKDAEDRSLKMGQPENLFKKLSDFLCCGHDKIESDIYPLLFINSPDRNMGLESLKFLKTIPWEAVFDFAEDRQNDMMYKYLNEELNQVFQTKCIEEFDMDTVDKKQMKETFDGLKESTVAPWVFCSNDTTDGNTNVITWNLKCKKSFIKILEFYKESIPKERARVMFLLLSKNYDIMQKAAIEVMIEFQDQCIIMAENELCASQWKDSILKGDCITKTKLEECCLIGLPWSHVNDSIQKMSHSCLLADAEISRSNGVSCNLPERMRNELFDLEILGMNDCKMQDEQLLQTEREGFKREVCERFYTGEHATWMNFYYPNQVLKREKSDDLRAMISKSLYSKAKDPDDCVRIVAIYHQPGAGGTTLGKHMLWEFRKDHRCCIIQNITSQTGDQLFRLFEYEDECTPKPLLALIDNGDDDLILSLHEDLLKRKRSETETFCVLLVCCRQTEMPANKITKNIMLTQNLSGPEKDRFMNKYQDLYAKFKDNKGSNPTKLLLFNIMKDNYNKECIENSIMEYVHDMYDRGKEGTLLKFIAFVNKFDLNFQAIPVACFDLIMSTQTRNGWECRLSQAARVLLSSYTKKARGGGKFASLRVCSSLLSGYILNAVLEIEKDESGRNKSIGEVSLEFLHSQLFKNKYYSSAQWCKLLRILLNVINKRACVETKRSQFSPLVLELVSEGDTNMVLDVLKTAYDITNNDPMVAQQIARFYDSIQNWEEANYYIEEAIQKSDRTKVNSYLWHTKGQICRSQLSFIKEKHDTQNKLDASETNKAIQLSVEAINFFRKVQDLSRNEETFTPNVAGYESEIQVTLELLDILSDSTYFTGFEDLRDFLLTRQDKQLSDLSTDDVEFLRNLPNSVYTALEELERNIHSIDDPTFLDQNKILTGGQLERYKTRLQFWFANTLPFESLNNKEKLLYNRRLSRSMGATSFLSLLKMRDNFQALENIYEMINNNLDDGSTCPEDYWVIIATTIALPEHKREPCMLAKAVELSTKHFECMKTVKNSFHILEACLYMTLLHWPRENNLSNVCPLSKLQDVITVWKNASSRMSAGTRRRDKILFYLCNGKDNHFFIDHQTVSAQRCNKNGIFKTSFALNYLARLEGILRNNGEVVDVKLCISMHNRGTIIQIPVLCPLKRQTAWNRNVYFVLGFGLQGLKAIDLTTENIKAYQLPTNDCERNARDQEKSLEYPYYDLPVESGITSSPNMNIVGDGGLLHNQNRLPFQTQMTIYNQYQRSGDFVPSPMLTQNYPPRVTTSFQSQRYPPILYQRQLPSQACNVGTMRNMAPKNRTQQNYRRKDNDNKS